MQGYVVYEVFCLNCEIDDPWVRRSGPKALPIWSNSENALIEYIISVLSQSWEKSTPDPAIKNFTI